MEPAEPLYPDEKLALIVQLLEAERIPYAIGGAIALFYWGEPRATADIDINVFLPVSEAARVSAAFVRGGVLEDAEAVAKDVAATAQARFDFLGTAVDLFFADLPFHESCAARAVRVPFGAITMNVLSAEDLAVCKVMFNRGKDWLDVEQVLYTRGSLFDSVYALRWVEEMLGGDHVSVHRLQQLVAASADWTGEPTDPA